MHVPQTIDASFVGGSAEEPFIWDGKVETRYMVEAVVIDAHPDLARYVVTQVISDPRGDVIDDYGNSPDLNTPGIYAPWFTFDIRSADLRTLRNLAQKTFNPSIPTKLDRLLLNPDDPTLAPGDMVHISEIMLWGDAAGHTIGHHTHEITKLEKRIADLAVFFANSARLKPLFAKHVLFGYAKKEQIDMQRLDRQSRRILPNAPLRPFANPKDYMTRDRRGSEHPSYYGRWIFGTGQVADHYVDVTACPAPSYTAEIGGIENFTASGKSLFTPPIAPFGPGSPEDPLYELEVKIHSSFVHNPAVREQRAVVTVDGVTYDALQDPEQSSSYYENPGHDVVFAGFRQQGVVSDTYEISPEQIDALSTRNAKELKIVGELIHKALDDGSFFTGGVEQIDIEADRRIKAMRAESSKEATIIAGIVGGNPDYQLPSGALLLVPKSMLDAFELTLPALE